MGWLFDTENDIREKKIISYAGIICMNLKNIVSRLEQDGGLNLNSCSFISNEMQSIISTKEVMESEMNQLPQSRIAKLYLPWMDGRNIPFHLWTGSYQLVAVELHRIINKV